MRASLLISHPKIYLSALGQTTDALLVREGRVVAHGARATALKRADEPVYRPQGACVFPALTDAHCHLWGIGMRQGAIDLGGARSVSEVLEKLRAAAAPGAPLPASGWVLGHGWDEHGWPGDQRLSPAALDQIFPKIPVCLHRIDRHAIVCNSEALRRAGLPSDSRADLLVDQAMAPVIDAIPAASIAEDQQLFEESARIFRSHGVSTVHMALTAVDRLSMLQNLAREQAMPIRVAAMIDGMDPGLDDILKGGPIVDPEGWFSAATIKFFADGALGSRGARLLDTYDDGTRGILMHEQAALASRILKVMKNGWQVAVHAIGDAAARLVLDIFEQAGKKLREQTRPRLEHAQMLAPEDCQRMADLAVLASIQPIHLRHDAVWAHQLLDANQLRRLFPWRLLAQNVYRLDGCELEGSGVSDGFDALEIPRLAAGSDFPIDDPNPWHGMVTALTRRSAAGEVFMADQVLTRREILLAYTLGAAFSAHQEHQMGTLNPGYLADFIALSHDPFHADIDALWQMQVLELWVGGARSESISTARD